MRVYPSPQVRQLLRARARPGPRRRRPAGLRADRLSRATGRDPVREELAGSDHRRRRSTKARRSCGSRLIRDCTDRRCALGFVLSHDRLFRLVHVPTLDGFSRPSVYRGRVAERRRMEKGKVSRRPTALPSTSRPTASRPPSRSRSRKRGRVTSRPSSSRRAAFRPAYPRAESRFVKLGEPRLRGGDGIERPHANTMRERIHVQPNREHVGLQHDRDRVEACRIRDPGEHRIPDVVVRRRSLAVVEERPSDRAPPSRHAPSPAGTSPPARTSGASPFARRASCRPRPRRGIRGRRRTSPIRVDDVCSASKRDARWGRGRQPARTLRRSEYSSSCRLAASKASRTAVITFSCE